MSEAPAPRRRRSRAPSLDRPALDEIGAALGGRIPPPIPPSLGEGLLSRANREGVLMQNPQIEGLLGRLLERSDTNGKQLDEMQRKMDRIDERLEGVAYRRDIESFMHRDEIERRIEKAAEAAKADGREGIASVRKDVGKLQGLVQWAGGGLIVSFCGLLLKLILSSAHIPT